MSRRSKIILATRRSSLALIQARAAARALASVGLASEMLEITSEGDLDRRNLVEIGGRGVFTKALEDALLDGRADAAVHSAKDLPSRLPEGLVIAAALPREDPRDALVSHTGAPLWDLPAGGVVGTSSPRRAAAILRLRRDLVVKSIRGNVPTRVRKVESGRYDAGVLAVAGLRRLDMENYIAQVFESDIMPSAPGQGAIVIETRRQGALDEAIRAVSNAPTHVCISAERALERELQAGCHAAVGALATPVDGGYMLKAAVFSADGAACWRAEARFCAGQAEAAGEHVARELLADGAAEALAGGP